jgi:transcriptional regulator with XRE-family HTH domain
MTRENALAAYLKDRRAKLDPTAFGFSSARRRTPGLRREEVAQRANISPTWYTSLEQGRGGPPSADVLNRLAAALVLTDVEREHLFLLGLGHLPEARYSNEHGVPPRLQRVLDALEPSPALIRTATWDVVAWNRAVGLVLTDYAAMPPGQRNILRTMFLDPRARATAYDWKSVARFLLGVFRADVARAGASEEVTLFIDELRRSSPEFRAMWSENEVRSFDKNVRRIRHPILGSFTFELSAFAIDGKPDLSMLVYNPVKSSDIEFIKSALNGDARDRDAASPSLKRA